MEIAYQKHGVARSCTNEVLVNSIDEVNPKQEVPRWRGLTRYLIREDTFGLSFDLDIFGADHDTKVRARDFAVESVVTRL